jgi:hypothetical protein
MVAARDARVQSRRQQFRKRAQLSRGKLTQPKNRGLLLPHRVGEDVRGDVVQRTPASAPSIGIGSTALAHVRGLERGRVDQPAREVIVNRSMARYLIRRNSSGGRSIPGRSGTSNF